MTAITSSTVPRKIFKGDSDRISLPVAASAIIFQNGLVSTNSTGYAIPAADTASTEIAGVAEFSVTGTAADGGVFVTVKRDCVVNLVAGTGINIADVGKNVMVADDQTVTDASTATNDVEVGRLLSVIGTDAYVHVGSFGLDNA